MLATVDRNIAIQALLNAIPPKRAIPFSLRMTQNDHFWMVAGSSAAYPHVPTLAFNGSFLVDAQLACIYCPCCCSWPKKYVEYHAAEPIPICFDYLSEGAIMMIIMLYHCHTWCLWRGCFAHRQQMHSQSISTYLPTSLQTYVEKIQKLTCAKRWYYFILFL